MKRIQNNGVFKVGKNLKDSINKTVDFIAQVFKMNLK